MPASKSYLFDHSHRDTEWPPRIGHDMSERYRWGWGSSGCLSSVVSASLISIWVQTLGTATRAGDDCCSVDEGYPGGESDDRKAASCSPRINDKKSVVSRCAH